MAKHFYLSEEKRNEKVCIPNLISYSNADVHFANPFASSTFFQSIKKNATKKYKPRKELEWNTKQKERGIKRENNESGTK